MAVRLTVFIAIEKEEKIREISNTYLLKDILEFRLVKNSSVVRNLLRLFAYKFKWNKCAVQKPKEFL